MVDLGILPTPMVYYARRRLRAAACADRDRLAQPGRVNGLKWSIGGRPPSQEEVALLKPRPRAAGTTSPDGKPGTLRTLDISFDYVGWLQETWVQTEPVELRIVVDPMHGCCGRRARRYLQAVFPMAPVSAVRDDPAADFGGDRPRLLPTRSTSKSLARRSSTQRADLGIATRRRRRPRGVRRRHGQRADRRGGHLDPAGQLRPGA